MGDPSTDARVLITSHAWSATPWIYSSLRFLQFSADGDGELVYGYGQTIYARILCGWTLFRPGRIRFTYRDSPPYQYFKGFGPDFGNSTKEVDYNLINGEVHGIESIVCRSYQFRWTLELSESPYPETIQYPYEPPRVFYGHREDNRAAVDLGSP